MGRDRLGLTLRNTQYCSGVLANGLDILRILAEAETPLTATAISERVGLHVSNVSRTLRVLMQNGYVRKPTYHSFAPDVGVLALAGSAADRLPAIRLTRSSMQEAARASGMQASLAALHEDQVLYLHHCQPDGATVSGVAGGFPLHRSVVGLRLLLDLPKARAIAALKRAARRYGWERPTPSTPADPAACLVAARQRLHDGILRTDHWDAPGDFAIALGVKAAGHPALAIALHGAQAGPDPIAVLVSTATTLTAILEQNS